MTLVEHLQDFRKRLVRSSLAILIATVAIWQSFPKLFALIRAPYEAATAGDVNSTLALTGVTTGFSLQLRVTLVAAVVLSSPVWIYQLWRFIAPGLHRNERRWAYVFTGLASPLFLAGVWLAYQVMPRMIDVLFEFTPSQVENVTSVDTYLSFFFHLTLFFGIGFLLPLFLVMLNFVGVLSGASIKSAWRWIILGSFVFGAVATPSGDPLGMTFVALPIMALTLLALGVALLNDRRRARKQAREGTDQWSDSTQSPL